MLKQISPSHVAFDLSDMAVSLVWPTLEACLPSFCLQRRHSRSLNSVPHHTARTTSSHLCSDALWAPELRTRSSEVISSGSLVVVVCASTSAPTNCSDWKVSNRISTIFRKTTPTALSSELSNYTNSAAIFLLLAFSSGIIVFFMLRVTGWAMCVRWPDMIISDITDFVVKLLNIINDIVCYIFQVYLKSVC